MTCGGAAMNGNIMIRDFERMLIFAAFIAATAYGISSAAPGPYANTFCNPVNLSYNFWSQSAGSTPPSYREAADPVIFLFKNEYYLVASHSAGYWWSADLLNWTFVKPSGGLNIDAWAPAAETWNDTAYFTAWGSDLCKSTDPKAGVWTSIRGEPGIVDPCLLRDDDNKLYCYSATDGRILVQQMTAANKFATIAQKDSCLVSDLRDHGFECKGDNNEDLNSICIEGPWMTKYKGTYYLQYGTSGTEARSYCDGCYVSSSPMGPFTFCPYSPISMRSSGFVTGTGHSCTFKDLGGRYWHITTVTISVLNTFERRLAIFPAGFDSSNQLHTDTYLGDYPQYLPGKAPANAENKLVGWMLLSFRKPVQASSTLSGRPATNAVDENIRTWWSATSANTGEWLRVDLGRSYAVGAIQTNFAEQDITYAGGRGTSFSHKYKIEGVPDTLGALGAWKMLVDKTANTTDVPHDYVPLDSFVNVRYVKVTNAGPMPGGCKFAIRDLRVFGNAQCNPPSKITSFSVSRSAADKRMATVSWSKSADVDGYIIRLGIAPDKLYNNYQVLGKDSTSRVIRSLSVGVTYYFAMDAYSECGVTKGTMVKRDDNSTAAAPAGIVPQMSRAGTMVYTFVGSRFALPQELRGNSYVASVYTVSGKFLGRTAVRNNVVDLPDNLCNVKRVSIVRFAPKR
jgi:xylan 1,4-beta-xylosidase